jgi:hypothetical protein
MATIANLIVNMIARTAGFEAGMNKAGKSVKSFQSDISNSIGSIRTVLRLGIIGRYTEGAVQGFTEMHKAIREGNDALSAFIQQIPYLGGIEKAFEGLFAEITGFTEVMEAQSKGTKAIDEYYRLFDQIRNNIEMINAAPGMEKQVRAAQEYKKKLKEIEKKEKTIIEAGRTSNAVKAMAPKLGRLKTEAEKEYLAVVKKVNDELQKSSMEKWNRFDDEWIRKANQFKEALRTPFEEFEDFADMLNNLFMKGLINIEEWKNGIEKGKKEILGSGMEDRNSRMFQEILPNLINISGLFPNQDPTASKLDTTNNLLREIRDGALV